MRYYCAIFITIHPLSKLSRDVLRKEGVMSTILKEGVLHEKNVDISNKEKVDKIMDTIAEPKDVSDRVHIKNPEGKALNPLKSAENNLKHAVFSKEVLIEGEDADDLCEIRDKLRKELKPGSEIESIIVDRIVSSIWRLKRCLKVESQVLEYLASSIQEYEQGFLKVRKRTSKEIMQLKSLKIIENKTKIEELSQYETLLERQIYKALGELEKMRSRESRQERKVSRKSK